MQFLITNDDGIDAPGIAALAGVVSHIGTAVVLAPHEHLSGCGHRVNTHCPLTVAEAGPGRYSVDGTPADCTRLGLLHVAPETDWVLSGINEGGNLGCDIYISGTVAAIREAALWGKPGIALSQYRSSREPCDWAMSAAMVRHVLGVLLTRPLQPGAFWNVNLPDLRGGAAIPEIAYCPLELSPLAVRYELRDNQYHFVARYQDRGRTPGSDVDHCFAGRIAVTQVLVPAIHVE